MFFKYFKFIFIVFLFYQSPLYSKSDSLNNLDSDNLSKYFSGIVAFDNKDNSKALNFFNSAKILLNSHDPYLEKYIFSLVLENKISYAVNVIKKNKDQKKSNFFDAYLLLILDSLKKNEFNKIEIFISKAENLIKNNRFHLAILENLKQYIYTFKENKILENKENFGKLTVISNTFQKCYLNDKSTEAHFLNLINDPRSDYTRYTFFYLTYLIENNRINDAKNILNNIDIINSSLLLSQGKSWIENEKSEKLVKVFSCKNPRDIIGEFLFLVSNLYSSQNNFEKSNFYLNLSNFLNPKFLFNLSLVAENYYLNEEYSKAKRILKNFKKEDDFYYWYRIKKEAQIISKLKNKDESIDYISSKFNKIENPNDKILFDIANFFRNSKKYEKAIKYYTEILENLKFDTKIKSEILYRRGGSFERIGKYTEADQDLLYALKIDPDDAYVLNYLAYSWLERDYKIDEAIKMLEKAYAIESDDPYIIDSIGWAYYLVEDYLKAEKFLKRAVELMPDDPIVNDHYGDILWKLNRKIQARYFWDNVLRMKDTDIEMIEKINIKMIEGVKNS